LEHPAQSRNKIYTIELIKKCQGGDTASFEKLVTAYQGKVFRLCLKLTGNRDNAEDLAQEVFIKAYHALKGFRLESDFGTWLHRIAVNMWLNIRKKESRVIQLSLDDPITTEKGEVSREIADPELRGNPLASLEEAELREVVRQALDALSEEHKVSLVLRDIEGYSYEEIASIMQCNLGTVKSRINRARKNLREILIRQNPE